MTSTGKLFSERHGKALRQKRFKITLPQNLRESCRRLLDRFSERGGWENSDNYTLQSVIPTFLERKGWQELKRWDGKNMVAAAGFDEFLLRGVPAHVLDAFELFARELKPPDQPEFWKELNELFEIHSSPLRAFDGDFYLIDSQFLESQVDAQAQELLAANAFSGPLEEFLKARSALTDRNAKDAIVQANNALESTMKAILGHSSGTSSDLIKKVCKSGLVPSYYDGFLKALIEMLTIVPTTRANEGGHGQGKEVREVPFELAELAVHLTGSLIVFLIKRQIAENPPPTEEPETAVAFDDDVPF